MKCDICGENAENLCLNCNKYYCKPCFEFVHRKNKNKNHKKEALDFNVPILNKCSIHPDDPFNLFCANEKELCCSLCHSLNLKPHEGHKLIFINDEESLKKENLTIDSTANEFDKSNEELLKLTEEIKKELIKIDNLYENTNKKVTNFFDEKRKKLLEEQNNLIDKLKNEVTKTREKLENFITECNNIISSNERINKGITKIKSEKDNNLRKILSYISAVNQNKKKVNELLDQSLINLNINFDENQSIIKYEEYNINTGKGLKISKILNDDDINLLVSWLPNKQSKINLLFDTTKDGDNASTFHNKCDGKSPTLVIIKSNSNYKFGGYVTASWIANNNNNINSPNSFIFSLNQKKKYYASSQQNSIINGGSNSNQKDSAMFHIGCCDIRIKHNCTNTNQNSTNCDKFAVTPQNILNGGNQNFVVSNLEVYEIKN